MCLNSSAVRLLCMLGTYYMQNEKKALILRILNGTNHINLVMLHNMCIQSNIHLLNIGNRRILELNKNT